MDASSGGSEIICRVAVVYFVVGKFLRAIVHVH